MAYSNVDEGGDLSITYFLMGKIVFRREKSPLKGPL